MLDVHRRIHELKNSVVRDYSNPKPQPFDPIPPVAEAITEKSWLICFDEFQVSCTIFPSNPSDIGISFVFIDLSCRSPVTGMANPWHACHRWARRWLGYKIGKIENMFDVVEKMYYHYQNNRFLRSQHWKSKFIAVVGITREADHFSPISFQRSVPTKFLRLVRRCKKVRHPWSLFWVEG